MLRHLPNALSGLRMFAAPALAFLLLHGWFQSAFALFLIAAMSDAVDGYLAKRFAPGSRFGAYLDPAADKLLMLSAFLTLTYIAVVPFPLTCLIIARDAAIIAGVALVRALALRVPMAPLAIGKASTAIQFGYVALVLLLLAFHIQAPEFRMPAAVVVAAVTAASWIAYGQVLLKAFALRRRPA